MSEADPVKQGERHRCSDWNVYRRRYEVYSVVGITEFTNKLKIIEPCFL